MVNATAVSANARRVGLGPGARKELATPAARSTGSATMVLVFVFKVGMENTALSVSTLIFCLRQSGRID